MNPKTSGKPSFSSGQRWAIFFSVICSIIAMMALVVMLNYLGSKYFRRANWSNASANKLSLQTIALLKTVTNQVNVTIYFDKKDSLYPMVSALLEEYSLRNPHLLVDRVDYLSDAARAQKVKTAFKLASNEDKNIVIFECEGRRRFVPATAIGGFTVEARPTQGGSNDYVKHLKSFEGEKQFSSALLTVTSQHPRKAYVLQGHGEHLLDRAEADGYQKFRQVLEENNAEARALQLNGTNAIPEDCTLLVIAGPRRAIPADELSKIRDYINEGGHTMVLFNNYTVKNGITTGLEALLEEWNVRVGDNVVGDPGNLLRNGALWVHYFSPDHPLSTSMFNSAGLAMINPRSIVAIPADKAQAGAPEAKELACTSADATVGDDAKPAGGKVPLIVVVEKARPKGVHTERGTTALFVAGDSAFFSNGLIDVADNRDFAGFTVNWLMSQNFMLQGVAPVAVKEYTLNMTDGQMRQLRWIFMGAMPGGVLLLGFAVWLRRRS